MTTNNNNNEIASTTLNHFSYGTEVEVSSDEEGFKGAWFRATIIAHNDCSSSSSSTSNTSYPNPNPTISTTSKRRRKILVEYRNLVTEDSSEQLREQVDLSHVRPLPPAVGCLSFEAGDIVDADYRDGWWAGVVKKALGGCKFRVFFDNPPDLIEFHQNQMRVHQDWIDGHWIRPKRELQMTGSHFSPGTDVEVNLENDDSPDVWIPAIVVKENKDNTFLVKFHNPKPKHWGDTVDFLHIRPLVPRCADKTYKLHEKVDAFHDSAWRAGEISKVLPGKTYTVTFKNGLKSKELSCAEIRPRGEWKGGKWEIKSKEVVDGSKSKTTEELEPPLKKTKNADEMDSQLESPPDAVDDKLEKKTVRHTCSGKNLMTRSSDKKGELVSSSPAPESVPNMNKTTPQAPSNGVRRGRRSIAFKDGFSEESKLYDITKTEVKKESLSALFTPVSERLTRTRKPVIPFKFESYKRSRRQSADAIEVPQTAPVKRLGRPKKSEVISPEKPAVGKIQNESFVVTKMSVGKKDTENKAELPSKTVSPAEVTEKLPAKVPPFLKEELQTLTIDLPQNSKELKDDGLEELKRPENGGNRINKRKRDNQQNGAEPVQEVVQKTSPVNEITLPVRGGISETPELYETYRRRRADASSTKTTANETRTVLAKKQNNRLVDDDRPLSTWMGTEAKSLGKNSDLQNGNKERADKSKGTPELNAPNKGLPENNQKLPFTKKSPVWKVVESMEIFRAMPQCPHFRPLYKCKEECREGLAIGHMVTFSSLVEKISKLRFEDQGSSFTSTLESLVDLENQGFNVSALRGRLNALLSIKDKLEPVCKEVKDIVTKITEQKDHKTKLAEEIEVVEKKMSELKEKQESIRVQIEMKDREVERLKQNLAVTNGSISDLRRDFEKLRVEPMKLV